MRPVLLFRNQPWVDPDERAAAKASPLKVIAYRTQVEPDDLVIGRYSILPYPDEVEAEVILRGGELINPTKAHRYVADVTRYAQDLEGLTPRSWNNWGNLPEGAYIVKGKTNSKKWHWKDRMFAETRGDVPRIVASLLDDAEIADQGLVVREYVPLVTYMIGLNGLPITNEWRFFVLHGKILIGGYYWANEPDAYPGDVLSPPAEAIEFVKQVILRMANVVPFYVVDVAEKRDGGWICIELNDGPQSGLSCIPPDAFYKALADRFV